MVSRSTTGASATRLAQATRLTPQRRWLPWYFYFGVALNIAAWASSWLRVGPWAYTFFPLWFGFILALDGLVYARTGTSPLRRSALRFTSLFLFSIPCWWVFEGFNLAVGNWVYHVDHPYSPLEFNLVASINFSTVLPAVMEMAELFASFRALTPRLSAAGPGPRVSNWVAALLLAFGILCTLLPILFPHYAFGLIWLAVIFLLDPINNLARRKSAVGRLLARDWRFFVTLPLAGLACGFFWEMWNKPALPKWTYVVPYVDAAPHLFEMPLPGYAGYLPFAIELFVMYQFLLMLTRRRQDALIF